MSSIDEQWKDKLEAELQRIMLQQSAREVAGKEIGKNGLPYITGIVLIGVVSSYFLEPQAITAVMTVIGAALMAIIGMLSGITGTLEKPDRPEFDVIKILIEKLDLLAQKEQPRMSVDVDKEHVTIQKGEDRIVAAREKRDS